MMSRSIIWFVAAALAAGAVQAKTVMWYRFEEQAPLTSTAAVKVYRDYAQVGSTITASYLLAYPSGNHTLSIGGTGSNPAHIRGNFDELRVSEGVLPVSAFLRAQPNGSIMIVR